VSTFTSNERGAGTDANVYSALVGEAGTLAEQKLSNTSWNLFERGQKDMFTIQGKGTGVLKEVCTLLLSEPQAGSISAAAACSPCMRIAVCIGLKPLQRLYPRYPHAAHGHFHRFSMCRSQSAPMGRAYLLAGTCCCAEQGHRN
jgi:hypothetical protein